MSRLVVTRPAVTNGPRRPGTFLAALMAVFFAFAAVGCEKSTNPNGNGDLRAQLIAEGQASFITCAGCHGVDGRGHAGQTPPLLHSDFIAADPARTLRILLLGLPNPIDTAKTITVNGLQYTAPGDDQGMPSIENITGEPWSDRKIAAVLSYVRAIMNDSTAVNCVVDSSGSEPAATCEKQYRPASVADYVNPADVGALRDSLEQLNYYTPPVVD
jgi:mono/diheme cytochrome c family protein